MGDVKLFMISTMMIFDKFVPLLSHRVKTVT